MFQTISHLFGGLGMLLLGMTLMSEGLKSFAGDSLRKALLAFTGRPVTAFFSGMVVTALIQSSSATTLMTIGFVSAGVLPFAQSVGVLMGAALGTTSTGWIVSIIGLNVSVSSYALLFVGLGAAVRIFLTGRAHFLGTAVAGFGLVFIGIGLLQNGMSGVTAAMDFSILPSGSFAAHLLILLIGLILTMLMQSCSAVMATNLMALSVGALNFEQAAALSIGAAIGTTVTAGIASIGASNAAKRSALALAIFSLTTGILALVLMPVLLALIAYAQRTYGLEEGPISLAVFHSLFISIGVALFLPFLNPYSRWIEHLLPDRGTKITRYLDKSLLGMPPVALEAIGRALIECRSELAEATIDRIQKSSDPAVIFKIQENIIRVISEMRVFLVGIEVDSEDTLSEARRISDFHILDHLQRLTLVIAASDVHAGSGHLLAWETRLIQILRSYSDQESELAMTKPSSAANMGTFFQDISAFRKLQRVEILREAALAGSESTRLLQELDAIQWLTQVAYHFDRMGNHFPLVLGFTEDLDSVGMQIGENEPLQIA